MDAVEAKVLPLSTETNPVSPAMPRHIRHGVPGVTIHNLGYGDVVADAEQRCVEDESVRTGKPNALRRSTLHGC